MQHSIISDQDKAQIKRTLRKDLKADVNLRLFTQRPSRLTIPGRECPYCPQAQQLMEEISELSPKLHLEIIDFYQETEVAKKFGVSRVPAIVIGTADSSSVKFYGMPAGYELATIVEGIKTISRNVSPLSMDTRKKLRQVNQPVHIQVFVTPTCPYCPNLARVAHAMALESPQISADVVEIQEFPALGHTYGIQSVPSTVINETIRFTGATTEAELVDKVLQAGVASTSEKLDRQG